MRLLFPIAAIVVFLVALLAAAQPSGDQWKATVAKAAAFLKKPQNEDGSWGQTPQNRGITGVAVTGLIRTGTNPEDEPVARGIKFIESLVNEKEGHIAGKENPTNVNYDTSINIMALQAANKADKYKAVIGNAAKYLKAYQWDEDTGNKKPDSDYYG